MNSSLVKFDETHFSIADLAKLWRFKNNFIRDLFRDEPGVVKIGNPKSTRAKRRYTQLRIPASVAERVHRRMQNA